MTTISWLALLALGHSPRTQAAPQVSATRPHPEVLLDITNMELFAPNSMQVTWAVQKKGFVKFERYTITLVLTRSGVTERVGTTASGAATSASIDLRGISAANRARLFGPNLRVTAILKADFTGQTARGFGKFVSEIEESKTFGGDVASPIAK